MLLMEGSYIRISDESTIIAPSVKFSDHFYKPKPPSLAEVSEISQPIDRKLRRYLTILGKYINRLKIGIFSLQRYT